MLVAIIMLLLSSLVKRLVIPLTLLNFLVILFTLFIPKKEKSIKPLKKKITSNGNQKTVKSFYCRSYGRHLAKLILLVSPFFSLSAHAACEFNITPFFGGFNSQLVITNNSGAAVNGWQVELLFASAPDSLSGNANITGSNPFTLTNVDFNGNIPDGGSVSVFVQGRGDDIDFTSVTGDLCGPPAPLSQSLTLEKTVINNNGGTQSDTAWTLQASNGTTTINGEEGDAEITNAVLNPGTYTLSESGPTGYTQTSLVCTGTADTNPSDGLTISAGEDVNCTFTNDDDPPPGIPLGSCEFNITPFFGGFNSQLVITNNSGAAVNGWQVELLFASAPDSLSGNANITGSNPFTLTNVDFNGNIPDGGSVSVFVQGRGDDIDFTSVTGDLCGPPAPLSQSLTLEKTVINNNGGTQSDTAWTLQASNGTTTINGEEGDAEITNAVLNPGTYTLSESGPTGYTQTSLVCTGTADTNPSDGLTISAGEDVNCTFTNDDDPPHTADISVTKDLVTAGPYTSGQTITYSITVGNSATSEGPATNVVVTDIPTNLTITNVSSASCSSLPCTIPVLAVGASEVIIVQATIL